MGVGAWRVFAGEDEHGKCVCAVCQNHVGGSDAAAEMGIWRIGCDAHEIDAQPLCAIADHVVTGEGEDAFRNICERVLAPTTRALAMVAPHVVDGGKPALASIAMPYGLYDSVDIKDRVVYGDPISSGDLAWVTTYAAVYTSIVLGIALWSFRRREFV